MPIRYIVKIFWTVLLAAVVMFIFAVYNVTVSIQDIEKAQEEKDISLAIAEELRQSSFNLSNFVRQYSITKDKRFVNAYHNLVDIRDGKAPRPYSAALAPGKLMATATLFQEVGFTAEEITHLNKGLDIANSLSAMEIQAMNAVDGLYIDEDGEYTIKGPPDRQLAINLLFSQYYNDTVARILNSVNQFQARLDARLNDTLQEKKQTLNRSLNLLTIAAVILVMALAGILTIVMMVIVKPVLRCNEYAVKVARGQDAAPPKMLSQNEITSLNDSIITMVNKLHSLVLRAEAATLARGEFLARVSHEIRTPMNAVIGLAYLGLQAHPTDRERDRLEKIYSAGKGLLVIIDDILDFSKIESGKMELHVSTFRVRDAMRDLHELLLPKSQEKGLDFTFAVNDSVPEELLGDSVRIMQICSNLCTNAIKFTSAGHVDVSFDLTEANGKYMLHCAVSDTGIGVSPEQQRIIFDSFEQIERASSRHYGGTGLGLAISKELSYMMGGEIWLETTLGKGSTFHFTVQVRMPGEHDAIQHDFAEIGPLPELDKAMRVLAVDDNIINLEIITEMLENFGITPTTVESGQQALNICSQEEFDIILMDIQMPGMSGFEATSYLRSRVGSWTTHVPIIALTAHAMSDDRQKSLDAGMDDHLTKPIDFSVLLRTMDYWYKKYQAEK